MPPDLDQIRSNVGRMVEQSAPEADIDSYLAGEGVTADQLRPPVTQGPPAPTISGGEAAYEGALSGASGGWRDEIKGASEASGMNPALGGFRAPFGVGKLWEEWAAQPKVKGDNLTDIDPNTLSPGPGPVEQKYTSERDAKRYTQDQAAKQHPFYYYGSEVAGSALTPTGKLRGVTAPGRALEAAGWGAGYGALTGAGEAKKDTGTHAVIGGGLGGPLGAAGVLPTEAAKFGAKPFRGAFNEDAEAARRIDLARTQAGGRDAQADLDAMHRFGQPAVVADVLGEPGRALVRSASDTSQVARQTLSNVLHPRNEEVKDRTTAFIRTMGGDDANLERDALKMDVTPKNKFAYANAYRAGDRPLWSPELERLTTSPEVMGALRRAEISGKNRAVADGYGGFNPGVQVTPDGRFVSIGNNPGVQTYPNLQFWDYAYRDLRDATFAGSAPYALAKQLRAELDRLVPEYGNARGVAARFFNADNALEAGANYFARDFDTHAADKMINTMSDEERRLFNVGFASAWHDEVKNSTTQGVQNRLNTARPSGTGMAERAERALGPRNAARLESFMAWENLMKWSHQALAGGSITARRAADLGLAGGVGAGGAGAMDIYTGKWSPQDIAVGSMIAAGARQGRHMVNDKVVRRVAEMLTSEDYTQVQRAIDMTASYPWLREAVRRGESHLARTLSTQPPYLIKGDNKPSLNPDVKATGGAVLNDPSASEPEKRYAGIARFADSQHRPMNEQILDPIPPVPGR